jgi:HEAT repeat protein
MASLTTLINILTGGLDDSAEAAALQLPLYGEEAVSALSDLLESTDPDRRWWALRALAEIDSQRVPALLHSGLKDPDPSVRNCAVLGLARKPYPAALPDLAALLFDTDRQLAGLARMALTALGEVAVPVMLEAASGDHPGARLEAFRALAEIGDRRAIPIFFKAVEVGDTGLIEYWAEIGLEKMGVGMAFFEP